PRSAGNTKKNEGLPLPGFFANPWIEVIAGCIVFGGLCTLSLDPFLIPGIVWICSWPLFHFADRYQNHAWKLLGIGALGAMFLCLFSFYWMLHLFSTYGGLNIALGLLIFIPYTILLNLKIPMFLVAFGFAKRFETKLPPMWLVAATLCVLTDYLAPQVFPWYWGNLAGKNRPLSQVAEFAGVYGISFLHFAGSYALYALFKTILHSIAQGQEKASEAVMSALKSGAWSDNRGKWAVPTLFAIVLVWGYVRLYQMANVEKQSPHVRVAMIQPNTRLPRAGEGLIPRDEVRDILENRIPSLVGKAAAAGPLDMIVLPESAVPNNLTTQDNMVTRIEGIYSPEFASMMQKLATKYKATVYANEVAADVKLDRVTGRPRPIEFNSSIVYSPDGGRREYYHKRTLLAFGEYIPGAEFLDSSGLIALVPEAVRYSRFERGESAHNLTYYVKKEGAQPAGTFLPLICYEVLIPEYVRSYFDDSNPGFIVNITQDGWYGKTVETYQHFGLGRIRAIELRRAIVRSTNSGSSGFVNLSGDYVEPLLGPRLSGQEVEEVQVWDVPVNWVDPTFYVRFGNLWILILAVGVAGWTTVRVRSRK
ncbi:MAG TPA: apolipoprotein N-acyltransferase, partial [Leptospiraceae bacterium]|nr:apolipoprotein N-acyltransferase [Leptospiraceae bacterium]